MGRPATLRVDIVTNANTRGVDKAESRMGKFGRGVKKAAKVGAAGLAAVGAAAVVVGKQVIDSASREQQAIGAVSTVFGKHAAKIRKYARGAADAVGLSRSAYSEMASVVGSQLQGMGIAQDKSVGKTRDLIKIGADLAATYGGSVEDAVGAVSSLMRGEADPIERYGVSIKQADVNARLAAQGLTGLTGKAAKQAQAQAVLGLLFEQTGKAQGAFARESNTLAGQQERLKAKFENLKATLGKKLLPVATKVTAWAGEKLLPAALKLGKSLGKHLGPAFQRVGAFITDKAVPAAKRIYNAFMRDIYPGIKRFLKPIIDGLRSAFSKVTAAIGRNSDKFARLGGIIQKVWKFSAPGRRILSVVLGGAFRVLGTAIGVVVDVLARLVGWIDTALDKIGKLSGPLRSVGGVLGKVFGAEGLVVGRPGIIGGSPSYAPGSSLAGFAWSTSAAGPSTGDLLGAAAAQRGGVYVDRRDYSTTIEVDGALDADSTARQIEELLARRDRRLGRRRKAA